MILADWNAPPYAVAAAARLIFLGDDSMLRDLVKRCTT